MQAPPFSFESDAEREAFAQAFGILLDALPPVGCKSKDVHIVGEPPMLKDEEWVVLEKLMPLPEKMRSKVDDRSFLDACLQAALLNFRWALMRSDPVCEAARKKISRFSVHRTGNLWGGIYEGVKLRVRPEIEALFAILAKRGQIERERVFLYRAARRDAFLRQRPS